MPSHRLNVAFVRNCPDLLTLKAALDTVGRPSDKDYGVLGVHDIAEHRRLEFAIFRTKEVKLKKVRKDNGSIEQPIAFKDELFEAAMIRPPDQNADGLATLEVYSGGVKSIDTVAEFLSILELGEEPCEVNFIAVDIIGTLTGLRDDTRTKMFQLASCKVKGYQDRTDEEVKGDFTVKFDKTVPTAVSMSFIVEQGARVTQVKLRYRREPLKRPIALTIRPTAFFNISCGERDDKAANTLVRELAGIHLTDTPYPAQEEQAS